MILKEITFAFENCESITINGKYICEFLVDDLHVSFRRIACNAISKIDEVSTVVIEISHSADQVYIPFNQQNIDPTTVFRRFLAYKDITSIDFTLTDGNEKEEKYSYWISWGGNSDMENENQTTYLSNIGNLYIVISKDKQFTDFFDMEDINNEKIVQLTFKMCDVK